MYVHIYHTKAKVTCRKNNMRIGLFSVGVLFRGITCYLREQTYLLALSHIYVLERLELFFKGRRGFCSI